MGKGKLAATTLALAIAALFALVATASANHSGHVLVTTGPAGGNGAFDAYWTGTTPDGSRAYFETLESLVAADTDTSYDVYERVGNTTTLISTGPAGGNGAADAYFGGVSADASKVFFLTTESLVSGVNGDTDNQQDVYQRSAGTTTLISTGPAGGNGNFDAYYDGISADGSHVFFDTDEGLVSGDSDGTADVYDRSGGSTIRVSTGPADGNLGSYATFLGASTDGSRVFFDTDEPMVNTDSDIEVDVYERSGGTTTQVSTGPSGGNGAFGANFAGISKDGTHVFFDTFEKLVGTDTDAQDDIYERFGGTTTQVSTGPIGGNGAFNAIAPVSAEREVSDDGSHFFFETREALASGDTDTQRDVYDGSGGSATRVSTGPSGGNGALPATFDGASQDATIAFFDTQEVLASPDTDGSADIYQRTGTTTTLVSTASAGGNGAFASWYAGSSVDGARVFFETVESLESADTDTQTDIYERFSSATTRISLGPTGGNGAATAFYLGGSTDGRKAFYDTTESLAMTDTDSSLDAYVAVVDALYPRPGGGSPLRVPLMPAFQQCTAPNSSHIAPLDKPSCTPSAQESTILTTATTGVQAAFARFDVQPGDTSTQQIDEADVAIRANISDVRKKSDGTDYTGQLILSSLLRITDRANGYDGVESGTVQDTSLGIPITCASTPDPAMGSNCNIVTTTDTLVPGFAKEGKRAVISTFTIKALDAGADGSVTPPSGSCPPTCGSGDEKTYLTQGVFTP